MERHEPSPATKPTMKSNEPLSATKHTMESNEPLSATKHTMKSNEPLSTTIEEKVCPNNKFYFCREVRHGDFCDRCVLQDGYRFWYEMY